MPKHPTPTLRPMRDSRATGGGAAPGP
jgi:hypothetical protein